MDNAFSGILEMEESPVEGQQLQQKDKDKQKSHKTRCSSGKKGMLF